MTMLVMHSVAQRCSELVQLLPTTALGCSSVALLLAKNLKVDKRAIAHVVCSAAQRNAVRLL